MDINQKSNLELVINSEDHAQLIDGTIVVENMTSVPHNRAVLEISNAIKNHILAGDGKCEVFTENVALYVNELCEDDKNFFLPDVMVVCDESGIQEDGIHVAPVLVAEVTSEATKKYDYGDKLEVYRKIGVEEYWIVDLQRNAIFKYLAKEEFIPQPYMYPKKMEVSSYPGLVINCEGFMN